MLGLCRNEKGEMETRKVRVYRGFGSTSVRANIEVFYSLPGHGYANRLYSCLSCGTVLVLDMDNPELAGIDISEMIAGVSCPHCGETGTNGNVCEYPETFSKDGEIGHFRPEKLIPPDEESSVVELPEILPPR